MQFFKSLCYVFQHHVYQDAEKKKAPSLDSFYSESHCVVQAGLELKIFLLQPPKRWGGRCMPLWPAKDAIDRGNSKVVFKGHIRENLGNVCSYYDGFSLHPLLYSFLSFLPPSLLHSFSLSCGFELKEIFLLLSTKVKDERHHTSRVRRSPSHAHSCSQS